MSRKFCLVGFWGLGWALDKRNIEAGDTIVIARKPDPEEEYSEEELEQFWSVGKGLVKRVFNLDDIMRNRKNMKDWYFVWDSNMYPEENETLRKEGFKVCLGGDVPFKMEDDRMFGIDLAESVGLKSPMWKECKTPEEGIEYLEANPDKAFVFKPEGGDSYLTTVPVIADAKKANEEMRVFIQSVNIENFFILQERVAGTEVNVEFMCMDGEPVTAQISLEAKRISSDDKGCLCGCAFDTCRDVPMDCKLVTETVGRFKDFIGDNHWTGFFDCNVIIGEDGTIWFVEFCGRLGYAEHPNFFWNICEKDMLNTMADLHDGTFKAKQKQVWGAAITGHVDHPHKGIPIVVPKEQEKNVYYYDGMKEEGKGIIVETGFNKELFIIMGKGQGIKESMEDALENINECHGTINLDYRADGARDNFKSSPIRRENFLVKWGWI